MPSREKQQPGRELQIHGSARLAQSLMAADLIPGGFTLQIYERAGHATYATCTGVSAVP